MKPILFNTDMVKAILDGRKTVTRRLIKPQPWGTCSCEEHKIYNFFKDDPYEFACGICGCGVGPSGKSVFKSYVKKGDILYVRETWKEYAPNKYMYRADGEQKECDDLFDSINANLGVWHPSIHMPKIAARIFLRVTDVRVERLQDMNQEDALKEGLKLQCHRTDDDCSAYLKCNFQNSVACLDKFRELWNSTIPKRDPGEMYKYGWKANPWVWVIEFERISKEEAYGSKC